MGTIILYFNLSCQRKLASIKSAVRRDIFSRWIPAFAGMTGGERISGNIFISSVVSLMLAACSQTVSNTANSGLNTVEDNTSATWDKARDFFDVKRDKPQPPPKTQARYCYKFFEDIACYGKPIPGEEDRLVAWQGSSGQTGYVLDPAKPKEKKDDLPPLKTVDVPVPPKVAASPQLKEIIFDPAELQPKELVPQKTE